MTRMSQWCVIFALSVAGAAQAQAQAPSGTQLEIASLLESIASSACDFYRNGTWYDAKQAHDHLQMKYSALARGHSIASAEEFIARVATHSSLSGQPYRIRCPGAVEDYLEKWLLDRLMRYRAKGAEGITQPAPRHDLDYQPGTLSHPS